MTTPSLVTFQPSDSYADALDRAALHCGIEPEYWDIWGKKHFTTPEGKQTILRSLGLAVDTREELDQAVEDRLWNEWSNLLPPVAVVIPQAADAGVMVNVPVNLVPGTLTAEFHWENGETSRSEYVARLLRTTGAAELRNQWYLRKLLPLPGNAPLGYHRLDITLAGPAGEPLRASTSLILCPDRAYVPPALNNGRRLGGIAVGLYSVRSERDWGCGDFLDLEGIVDWAVEDLGVSFVALNPLHAIHNRQPFNTSPYLPNSIYYRNPLYLDVERVAGCEEGTTARLLMEDPAIRKEVAALRASELVEYERVWSLKLRVLHTAFLTFLEKPSADFQAYVETQGELLDRFVVYCALDEWIHRRHPNVWNWPDWPAEYRDPESPAVRSFARRHSRRVLFHKYLQWQVDVQLAEVQAHARRRGMLIGLYHDLALATDRCGSELWAHRSHYVSGCRVGSPPDDFSPDGQDWAFPPPNASAHRASAYRLFAESIRKNCRHGGALRIDHVMRLFHLFWIPDGSKAVHGAYVKDHHEDLLRILALESVRNQVVIIGEDLGTVAPEIRRDLERFGILSYRLLYFEKNDKNEFRLPNEYPQQALVSVTTHDLPTLAGFWQGRDIEARRRAGLLTREADYRAQMETRQREKQRLLEVLFRLGLLPGWTPRSAAAIPELTGELHNAVVGFLVSTPSRLMVLNQEDLLKQLDQQNLPGSTWQYPNWRRKMPLTLEELRKQPLARDCARMFRHWLNRSGRAARAD
jgi:4-alpha-glucanotransferase